MTCSHVKYFLKNVLEIKVLFHWPYLPPLFTIQIKLLPVFVLLLAVNRSQAQEFNYEYDNFKEWRARTSISAIHQSKAGNLLLLAKDSLYHYDGLDLRFIEDSKDITAIFEQKDKRFFAVKQSNIFEIISQPNHAQLKFFANSASPVQIYTDQNNQIWMAESSGLIIRLEKGKRSVYKIGRSIDQCYFLELDGLLWMITNDGLWYWFSNEQSNFVAADTSLGIRSITSVLKRTEQSLWVGGTTGIQEVWINGGNPQSGKSISHIPNINCLLDDNNDYIYVGCLGAGLHRIRKNDPTNSIKPVKFLNTAQNIEPVPSKSVYHLCLDRDRGIWVSSELGIGHLHAKSFQSYYGNNRIDDWAYVTQTANKDYYYTRWGISSTIFRIPAGQSDHLGIPISKAGISAVYCMTSDGDDVWASNSIGKIFRISNHKFAGILDLTWRGGAVFQVYADSKHRIWLAQAPNDGELPGVSYTDRSMKIRYFGKEHGLSNRIICFNENDNKQLYFGGVGNQYLYTFDEKTETFSSLSAPLPETIIANNMEVHDLACSKNGDVWLATTFGLLKYDIKEKKVTQVDLGSSLITATEIRSITIDQHDQVWLGTDVHGLLCYKNGKVMRFNLSDGIPSKNFAYRCISVDNTQRLWIGTDVGFGFSQEQMNAIMPTVAPTLYHLEVNGKEKQHLSADKTLEVPYGALVEIKFHCVSYPSHNLSYQSRIISGDKEQKWSEESKNSHCSFSDLSKGNYLIEIRGRQLGYDWSAPLLIKIQVQQVWYLQWWAFVLYFCLAALLIFIIVHYNSRQLHLKNIQLKGKVDAKTQELQEKNQEISTQNQELIQQNQFISQQAEKLEALNVLKDRLFSIISHDLRGPLGAIKGIFSLVSDDMISQKELKDITPELIKELDNTALLMDNLLLWAKSQMEGAVIHLERLDVYHLAEQQIVLFNSVAKSKHVVLKNYTPKNTMKVVDAQMTAIVLRNLVANAIKFCNPGDIVTISSGSIGNMFSIVVADTGVGISAANQEKLFKPVSFTSRGTAGEHGTGLGLLVCKEYIEKMGGSISFESAEGKGTTFYCSIPQESLL
jgi:signal transduction histidine kinase/streptogramin lyase